MNNNTAGKWCNYRSQGVRRAGEEEAAGEPKQAGRKLRWLLGSKP